MPDDREHGGPREDKGTYLYGTERIAAFSSRRPREQRYYGSDLRGSNRTVTDERGAVVGVQGFDSWGAPDPGKHAGNEQGNALLSELFGYTGERQDGWTGLSRAGRSRRTRSRQTLYSEASGLSTTRRSAGTCCTATSQTRPRSTPK